MEKDLLIKLQHFFEVDLKLKKDMISIAPSKEFQYSDESAISKYTDSINDFLEYTFTELKCMTVDIFGINSLVMQRINELEVQIKNNFYSCGFDPDKLNSFYKNFITNMEPEFVKLVKDRCVGYTLTSSSESPMSKATTINEILHFIHSYVLNNEKILQAMPEINKKVNEFKFPLILRGKQVPYFEELFNQFPLNVDVGWTDIVIINDRKLIMMVRDRGHALTIEVTLNNGTARVEYFIPKICNLEMVNNLPGINVVSDKSIGATGVFEVPCDELYNSLFIFISKVPMDMDQEFNRK